MLRSLWFMIVAGTDGRLHYSFGFGIVFLGSPKVDVSVQGMIPDVLQLYAGPDLQTLLASEEKELEDELGGSDTADRILRPVLSVLRSDANGKDTSSVVKLEIRDRGLI